MITVSFFLHHHPFITPCRVTPTKCHYRAIIPFVISLLPLYLPHWHLTGSTRQSPLRLLLLAILHPYRTHETVVLLCGYLEAPVSHNVPYRVLRPYGLATRATTPTRDRHWVSWGSCPINWVKYLLRRERITQCGCTPWRVPPSAGRPLD